MDDLNLVASEPLEKTAAVRADIKDKLVKGWDAAKNRHELANETMLSYIFGPNGENEHYPIDYFVEIIAEIDADKANQ